MFFQGGGGRALESHLFEFNPVSFVAAVPSRQIDKFTGTFIPRAPLQLTIHAVSRRAGAATARDGRVQTRAVPRRDVAFREN